jgi:HSP20 family protein
MAEATKLPVKRETAAPAASRVLWPFEALRREVDRLFEDFDRGFWTRPFRRSLFEFEPIWRREITLAGAPAVDIVDKDKAYEITADLPGYDEKDIEVKLSNGGLTIKGKMEEEKKEEEKNYYLHERHVGAFERTFHVPEDVDPDKIEARFKKGVLTVSLPKKPEAQRPEKKIEVKAA